MLIHTVRAGDTIFGIAKKYGVPPSKIIEYNDLKNPDRLPVGLEVLIVMPTRYYAARRGEGILCAGPSCAGGIPPPCVPQRSPSL